MSDREGRIGLNEAVFREVNERISEVAVSLGGDDHLHEFLCECAAPGCTERITLTLREYEHVRSEATRFVLAPGHRHVVTEIENVVERNDGHVVVEAVGAAAEVAAELDPRAA